MTNKKSIDFNNEAVSIHNSIQNSPSLLNNISALQKRKNSVVFNATMSSLLQLPLAENDDFRKIMLQKGIDPDSITEASAICFAQIQRAKVDNKAFEIVRDTIGQKPIEKQVVLSTTDNPADIIARHFSDNSD